MNKPVRTTTPSGDKIVILSAEQFDNLVEAAEDTQDLAMAEKALRDFENGIGDVLTDKEVGALLQAPHPLAFWRKHRGLTQAALAGRVDVSQAYLAQIEKGNRVGDVELHRRLAEALRLDIEDLLPPKQAGKQRRQRAR